MDSLCACIRDVDRNGIMAELKNIALKVWSLKATKVLQTVYLSLSAIINYIFISEKQSRNLKQISAKIYVKYNLILLPFEKCFSLCWYLWKWNILCLTQSVIWSCNYIDSCGFETVLIIKFRSVKLLYLPMKRLLMAARGSIPSYIPSHTNSFTPLSKALRMTANIPSSHISSFTPLSKAPWMTANIPFHMSSF